MPGLSLSQFTPALCWVLLVVACAIVMESQNVSAQVPHAMRVASYARGFLPVLDYDGRRAHAAPDMPPAVQRVVDAANRLHGKPYVWGGGHKFLHDRGYDCSGSVSYVLHLAGLLPGPRLSQDFERYGAPGPG